MKNIILICFFIFLSACSSVSQSEEDAAIQQIESDLSTIENSDLVNRASSNPNDYITAHLDEFDNMVSKKNITLKYFLEKFENSDEDGLREYIMASVCIKILGDKNPVQEWSSGREWYEKYESNQE